MLSHLLHGLWVLVVVSWLGGFARSGASLLAGIPILSVMIFPTITVVSHAAIQAVPKSYLYASTALGVSRSSTIRHMMFHQAQPAFSPRPCWPRRAPSAKRSWCS